MFNAPPKVIEEEKEEEESAPRMKLRNMIVVTGISTNKGQLPGYNTVKLDLEDYLMKELT